MPTIQKAASLTLQLPFAAPLPLGDGSDISALRNPGADLLSVPTGFTRQHHSFVHTGLLRDLSDAAVKVLVALKSFINSANGCAYPSLTTLCEVTGKSRPTVVRALAEMVGTGVLLRKTVARKSATYMLVERFPIYATTVGLRLRGANSLKSPPKRLLALVEVVHIPNEMRRKEQMLADAVGRAEVKLQPGDTDQRQAQRLLDEIRPLITDYQVGGFPIIHRIAMPCLAKESVALPDGRLIDLGGGGSTKSKRQAAKVEGLSGEELKILEAAI